MSQSPSATVPAGFRDSPAVSTRAVLPTAHAVRAWSASRPDALHQRLLSLAASHPDKLALLHKEHGQWRAYAWQDLVREVTQLAIGLRSRGLNGNGRLAVCGPFEPFQLMLALAADQLRAQVLSVPTGLGGQALQTRLRDQGPTVRHAYVHARRDIAAWTVSPAVEKDAGHLFTRRSSMVTAGRWRSEPVASLYEQPRRDSQHRVPLHASLRAIEIAWAQEGSDWVGGLDILMNQWLQGDFALALPETLGTAAHDRIEIQPSRLILSPAACEQFRTELQSRLPQQEHWASRQAHRIATNVLHGAGKGGFVRSRVARLLGLSRLTGPRVPVAPSAVVELAEFEAGAALCASVAT